MIKFILAAIFCMSMIACGKPANKETPVTPESPATMDATPVPVVIPSAQAAPEEEGMSLDATSVVPVPAM